MKRQTSENKDLPDRVKLESMLMKHECRKTHNVRVHKHPGMNGFNSLELDEEATCKGQNCALSSDADGESPNKKVNEFNKGFPDVVPMREIRLPPSPLYIQTQDDDQMRRKTEEPMEAGAASLHKESPSQQPWAFHPPKTQEKDALHTDLKDEAFARVSKLTRQKHVNATSRTGRSASDPEGPRVIPKPKEPRRLSAPNVSNLNEYEEIQIQGSLQGSDIFDKGRKDSLESFGEWEHELSIIQNEEKKNKFKTLTQKLVDMMKEKPNRVRTGSKSSQNSMEEESFRPMEMEVEAPSSPPPLPPKRGRYVHLNRTFTLKDFKLNLEPINLLEEIFTGEEWLPYLPSKTSPSQKDFGDQATPDNVLHPDKDAKLHFPPMTTEQNQREHSLDQSHVKQDIINEDDDIISDLDSIRKDNRHLLVREVESNANIFAIPKALLTNATQHQRPRKIPRESKSFDDVSGMFMIPKYDFLPMDRRSIDIYLDFSAVKSSELLDNTALKSRIHLSKKRRHKPPKKYMREKAQRMKSKFYDVPV